MTIAFVTVRKFHWSGGGNIYLSWFPVWVGSLQNVHLQLQSTNVEFRFYSCRLNALSFNINLYLFFKCYKNFFSPVHFWTIQSVLVRTKSGSLNHIYSTRKSNLLKTEILTNVAFIMQHCFPLAEETMGSPHCLSFSFIDNNGEDNIWHWTRQLLL